MKEIVFKETKGDGKVKEILGVALGSMEENIVALVEKPVSLKIMEGGLLSRDEFLDALEKPWPALVGKVSKEYSGNLCLLVNLADAATLACLLRMVAQEIVEERRAKEEYDNEDREAFGEVGNILFSVVDEVFRKNLPKPVSFRLVKTFELEPGSEGEEVFPEEELYALRLDLKVGDFPEGESFFVLPSSFARELNGGPLDGTEVEGGESREEEALPEELEGNLVVFGVTETMGKLSKEAGEKIGLQVDVRPPGEVPNPATLKDCIVLLEIPDEEEKYLQWCRRLKKADPEVPILAALGWPTKRNVLLAFKAGADQILGLPCRPGDILRKVWKVIQDREHKEEAPAS